MVDSAPTHGGTPTFPALFLERAHQFGPTQAFFREKDYGIWQSYTWRESLEQTRDFANGLAAMGFKRGDRICIVGDNRPHLYWGMLAAQSLGGVPVPLYQDSIEREMQFIVDHAEASFALVEDQEQADKMVHIKAECPNLRHVIYEDPRGMRNYRQAFLNDFAQVKELGRRFAKENPGHFEAEIAKGGADDLAVMCYTSGTTGRPKGVMLSHRSLIETSRLAGEHEHMKAGEEVVAYLPMAWIGDFIFSFAQALALGLTVNCPESTATVMHDMKEIGPAYFFAPPRIWENILTSLMVRIEDASRPKRWMFHYFMGVATGIQKRRQEREPVPLRERLLYALGNLLVYGPLKDNLGMSRLRSAYTAGGAIGPQVVEFFRALGINLKLLYGLTEASVFISIQEDWDPKTDTTGPPLPWVSLRFSEAGEVQFRSVGMFQGYFKDEEATRETLQDGWVHTGDAGILDRDGHLKIIDRVKDVGRLADGTLFAPTYLENLIKFSPYIKEAVAVGREQPYVAVMLNIDTQAVGNWAERRNLAYTGYTDLAQKAEVYDLVEQDLRRVNHTLGQDDALRGARVRKFLILHKELDPDDEEITRTRKVRRRFINEKYKTLIDALYSDAGHVPIEAKVTFEDGRSALVRANLAIRHLDGVA